MAIERIQQHFRDSAALTLEALETLSMPIATAIGIMFSALANGNKILTCGTHCSTVVAQQFAAQLINRFERERPGLPAIALSAEAVMLTALGEHDVYAKQIRALGQAEDVLFAVTVMNEPINVLAAIAQAHEREMAVVTLTGNDDGKIIGEMLTDADIQICVPSERIARIQEMHVLTLHCLCDGIDAMLLGEN